MLATDRRQAADAGFYGALLVMLVATLSPICARALNPDREISQYAHSAWRVQDGYFPGTPWSMTQTTDGYIWIGTTSGIVRFDGVRFARWVPPNGEQLRDIQIAGLLGTSDGSLWISTWVSGLWQWKLDRLTHYPLPSLNLITAMIEQENGDVLVAVNDRLHFQTKLCEAKYTQLKCEGLPSIQGQIDALSRGSQGQIWIGTDTAIARWSRQSSEVQSVPIQGTVANTFSTGGIVPLSADSAWVGVATSGPGHGLQLLSHNSWSSLKTKNWDSSSVGVFRLLLDRQKALWVGTVSNGLYRIRGGKVDHFGASDGMTGDDVRNLFEDREGNVWVQTSEGVDCFRDLAVSSFSRRQGLAAAEFDTVIAGRDGSIWTGGDHALDKLDSAGITSIQTGAGLPGAQVTSLLEDHRGQLWVGVDHALWIFKDLKFSQITSPDRKPLGMVVGLTEDNGGDIWAEISGTPRKLVSIQNGRVKDQLAEPRMPSARRVKADPHGGLWLGLINGDLARFRDGKLDVIPFPGSDGSYVNQLSVNADGTVIRSTDMGIIGWRDGKQQILDVRNGLPCNGINSFITDNHGGLWIYAQCGLIQLPQHEFERWWKDSKAVLHVKTLDASDGVQAGSAPFESAARTPDGKLWFVNEWALQMVDPDNLPANTIPPPVHVEEVSSGPGGDPVEVGHRFPPLTRNLAIRYTALSFVSPQKVLFRYMLEGKDKEWQEARTRREVFYTNLGPGNYRFRVIACNNNGLWNEAGDSFRFSIAPAYYQTRWFLVLCIGATGFVLWWLYLIRLKQAHHQIEKQLGARLEERERIARELHDTLLQGIQGLMLRFQAVLNTLPKENTSRPMMEDALDRADQVLLEGRRSVRGLRAEGESDRNLGEALVGCGEDLAQNSTTTFFLSSVGSVRTLQPGVVEQGYRVAREALINAFQHAKATRVEVEITYLDSSLVVRVRDDGSGIDEQILGGGREGHWGLSGMRERAQQIGGELKIWSRLGAGTEIELLVPANVAYQSDGSNSYWACVLRGIKRLVRIKS